MDKMCLLWDSLYHYDICRQMWIMSLFKTTYTISSIDKVLGAAEYIFNVNIWI